MKTAFIFDTVWQLSLAEIISYLKRARVEWTFVDLTKNALVIDAEINADEAIDSLGGTLKIAEITKEFEFKKIENTDFENHVDEPISFYGSHELFKAVKKKFPGITPSGVISPKDMKTKRKYKSENILIFGLKNCYFGPTVAVQPFITKYDDHEPFKTEDLPASRAMMLINLAQAGENVFIPNAALGAVGCGAAMLNIKRISLEENDKIKLAKAKNNVIKYGGLKVKAERDVSERGFHSAACVLPAGPDVRERIPKKDAEDILRFVRKEQKATFERVVSHCPDGATFACVFPVFNSFSGKIFAGKYFDGVRMVDPFERIPDEYRKYFKIERKMTVDEEPGRRYVKLREFCVYVVKR
ncbi:hypothetical protein H0N95_01025 [Candidatus Micrarchaeota archaeon]|nr:hypothetical protein [Candidatus Micrarchaeota archaeon]